MKLNKVSLTLFASVSLISFQAFAQEDGGEPEKSAKELFEESFAQAIKDRHPCPDDAADTAKFEADTDKEVKKLKTLFKTIKNSIPGFVDSSKTAVTKSVAEAIEVYQTECASFLEDGGGTNDGEDGGF